MNDAEDLKLFFKTFLNFGKIQHLRLVAVANFENDDQLNGLVGVMTVELFAQGEHW